MGDKKLIIWGLEGLEGLIFANVKCGLRDSGAHSASRISTLTQDIAEYIALIYSSITECFPLAKYYILLPRSNN